MPKLWKPLVLVLPLLLLLGGCGTISKAYLNEAVDSAREFKEGEARLLLTGLCAMGIGAMYRELSSVERAHVNALCGGEETSASIPLDTLRELGFSIEGPE